MLAGISNRSQHVSIDLIMIDLDAFLSDREKKYLFILRRNSICLIVLMKKLGNELVEERKRSTKLVFVSLFFCSDYETRNR